MIPTKQKLVLAVAGAACAAVWGPQVLGGAGQAETSGQAASGPSEDEMAKMTATLGQAAAPGGGASAQGGGKVDLAPKAGEDVRANLGGLLAGLQNFGAGSAPRSLDDIAGDWARTQGDGAHVSASGAASDPSSARTTSALDALDEHLTVNPFRGTLVFKDDAIALLGPNAVRVGDELLEGEAVVAEIQARSVTISFRGIPRRFTLPAVRAQEPSQSGASGATPQGGGAAGAAAPGAESAAGAAPGAAPVTPAAN